MCRHPRVDSEAMTGDNRAQQETLRLWHCPACGYANAGKDPCAGCHKRAPRQVRANTRARPRMTPQTALCAEVLAEDVNRREA
jgi:hypothetical protein